MKRIIRCILGLGSFLTILLIVIMVLCTLFVTLTNRREKKELETKIVETNAQLDFVFNDSNVITQEDFENNIVVKEFEIFNSSDSRINVASAYQLNFNILKYRGFKLGDMIYTISGSSTGEGSDDKLIDTGTLAFPSFSSSAGIGTINSQVKHSYSLIIKYLGKDNIKEKSFEVELNLVGNITYLKVNNN